jgi:hypothetical protein
MGQVKSGADQVAQKLNLQIPWALRWGGKDRPVMSDYSSPTFYSLSAWDRILLSIHLLPLGYHFCCSLHYFLFFSYLIDYCLLTII